MDFSLIVPCYNEAQNVRTFFATATECLDAADMAYELVFVDDGSSDGTMAVVRAEIDAYRLMRPFGRGSFTVVRLSRNFGKEAAMYAGLQAAQGDYVSIMDVDLQDPPSMLPELLGCVRNEGYDCAAVRRVTRSGEPRVRSFFARAFYKIVNRISRTEIVDGARDYRVMTRQMVDSILEITEVNRF